MLTSVILEQNVLQKWNILFCGLYKGSYFAKLYDGYNINQILAHRFINAHAGKREKETELLIMNY